MKKYVTQQEVVEVIKSVKTANAITIEAETEPIKVKSNPYYGVKKRNTTNGQIGFYYKNAVNNQLAKEDKEMDFVPQMAKWQKPTDSRNLVTNADGTRLYLYIRCLSSGEPTFFFKGEEISRDLIAPFLPEHKTPHTQENLDKEVVVRTFAIDNILNIKMLGDEYCIVENLSAAERTQATQEQQAVFQASELSTLIG